MNDMSEQQTKEKPTVEISKVTLEQSRENRWLHRGVKFKDATEKDRGYAIVVDQHELGDTGGYSVGNLKDRLKASVDMAVNILSGGPGPDGEPSFERCPAFPVDGKGAPAKVTIIIKVD